MNNKIVFDDINSNKSGNDELLKENTPETVDYNKLYNIQENSQNNLENNETSDINLNTINSKNIINEDIKDEHINESDSNQQKKKGISSLLLVFIIFLIIMGAILFLFPFLWRTTLN